MNGEVPTIEHERLESLRQLGFSGGVDLLGPMIAGFLRDTPGRLDGLARAVRDRRPDDAKAIAHALRGLSSQLGAARLAELARRIEEDVVNRDAWETLVEEVRTEFARVRQVLEGDFATGPLSAPEETTIPEVFSGLRPARVLVADDEPHVARLVAFVLLRAGYAVTVAHDGDEALAAIGRSRPDALVLDLVMPRVGGLETLARLRAAAAAVPPTLILTARATAAAKAEILAAGASAHGLKPIAPSTLLRRLEEMGVPPRVARNGDNPTPPAAADTTSGPEDDAALAERSAEWETLEALYDMAGPRGEGDEEGLLPRLLERLRRVRPGIRAVLWSEQDGRLEPVALTGTSATACSVNARELVRTAFQENAQVAADTPTPRLAVPLPKGAGRRAALEVWQDEPGPSFDAAFVRLAESIAAQSALLLENEALHRAAAEREKLEQEMAIAGHIQQTLLVAEPPADLRGLEAAAITMASRRVDGDFHDFVPRGACVLDTFVGDVMGKGVGAALLGAATKTQLLRALACPEGGPAAGPERVVHTAHAALGPRLVELESFVTLAYARFDSKRRVLSFVDCGHTRILRRDRSGTCHTLEGGNLPLGFSAKEEWKAFEVALEPGDVFLLYSDGVTEARSPQGDLFGVERLQRWLASRTDRSPRSLVKDLRGEIAAFSGIETPTDDLTCVAVRIGEEGPCA